MGITGLIPFVEKASSKVHLKDLRDTTVAVDTYCWLHKGAFSCAEKIVRGETTDQYLQYCLKYVNLLLSYNIKPILVFDGRHLPAKALTERRRRESRQQSKKRAAELLRLGNVDEARSHMRRCVDITHEMALRLIKECRLRNVDCIVAPYEADAQMAWLNKIDVAQYIITEDSDLTLFGAKKIIFKLDLTGSGLLVESEKLYLAMGCREEKYDFDKFRRMCILSGCDYLDSLPGIGLSKACKFILMTNEDDMWKALKKIPQYLNMKNLEVSDEYIDSFLKAEATFKHMYIYNPIKRQIERLHELDDFNTDERYCSNAGTPLESEQAFQLALGNLNPFTLQALDNWNPDQGFGLPQAPTKNIKRAKHKSIWQCNFQSCTEKSERHAERHAERRAENSIRCAFQFSKIDFATTAADEELKTMLKEENAKLGEQEIFSMYKNLAEENNSPVAKRRRSSSDSDSECSSMSVRPLAVPKHHNPFSKVLISTTENVQKSSRLCGNRSLLKALSPKKCKEELNVCSLNTQRNLFTTKESQIEIRSRFFAENVQHASKTIAALTKLSDEINKIESLSQQKECHQALLYTSPSPKRQCKPQTGVVVESNEADSGTRSISASIECERDCDRKEKCEQPLTDYAKHNTAEEKEVTDDALSQDEYGAKDDAIVLSDDDEVSAPTSTKVTDRTPLDVFKPKPMRRLGLSAKKSNPRSKDKKKAATVSHSQSQTRLSMFGFQKRPILK